jgi:putative transcriptional regulator
MKNKLEELRKNKGLSQEQLAENVLVSRQTIISLEKGRYNPSLDLAFRLSKFFNAPIEDIFIYEEE